MSPTITPDRHNISQMEGASPIITVTGLNKTYSSGFTALKNIDLTVQEGEIFALLGPNGAGKTTLISIICGLVMPSSGTVKAKNHDIVTDYKQARSLIGLVPQELTTDTFETVWATVSFSRGLFGKPREDALIERILRSLSLWDKRNARLITLSGGMKRRVLIAKALSHEPRILFLDEPTAGVDVALRKDMWTLVRQLRNDGVTIILTTHYIEEAEQMADRIGIIRGGEIVLVEDKNSLMRQLGKKELALQLRTPLEQIPATLDAFDLQLRDGGHTLIYTYGTEKRSHNMSEVLQALAVAGIEYSDLATSQSSLEEIFVALLGANA